MAERAEAIVRNLSEAKPVKLSSAGIDVLELFAGDEEFSKELQELGFRAVGHIKDLSDPIARFEVAQLVIKSKPRACHLAMTEGLGAEAQRSHRWKA